MPPRVGDDLGNGGAVAQAEIEALRADRRHHVRRLADERDAPARKRMRRLDRERKDAAARLDAHLAEERMRAALDLGGQAPHRFSRQARRRVAGSSTQTRLERRPGRGTSVNGPLSVWNSVDVS